MKATRTTTTTASVPNRAQGYTDRDKLHDSADWPAVRPSGAFLSTVLDLAKWDAVLYTDNILSVPTRRQMWTPVTLNDGTSYPYGFGWELGSVKGHKEVHHGGGIPGFLSEFARFVDDRITIVVLINLDDADVKSIAREIATFYLPAPVPHTRSPSTSATTSSSSKRRRTKRDRWRSSRRSRRRSPTSRSAT